MPDFDVLVAAVDFSTVGVAILAIAALVAVEKVVAWGASYVLSFLGGDSGSYSSADSGFSSDDDPYAGGFYERNKVTGEWESFDSNGQRD